MCSSGPLRTVRTGATLTAVALFLCTAGAARAQDPDALLNAVYQQTMSALPAPRQHQLRSAERAWIIFRDKNSEAFLAVEKTPGTVDDDLRSEASARCSQCAKWSAGRRRYRARPCALSSPQPIRRSMPSINNASRISTAKRRIVCARRNVLGSPSGMKTRELISSPMPVVRLSPPRSN